MGAGNNEKIYFGSISTKLFPPFIFHFGSQKKKNQKNPKPKNLAQPRNPTLLFSALSVCMCLQFKAFKS